MTKECLPPIVDQDSRVLLLGTMPGDQSIALQQYYGNRGNYFWKLLFEVFDTPFSADYSERLQLLKRHKVALWNTLASCEREGSRDDKIKNAKVNDFKSFFERYPYIRHVFFESVTAAKYYHRYAYKDKTICYLTLPSTSGLNSRMPYGEKLEKWQQLKAILYRKMV